MLELSDYEENEEAHKSSNVECVEVNNGIKMANKRSKSLEKEETNDFVKRQMSNDLLKRPDTAPPSYVPALNANKEIDKTSLLHLCDRQHQQSDDTMNTKTDVIDENNYDNAKNGSLHYRHTISAASWHEHIYRKPPKAPTPYSITDILTWGSVANKLNAPRAEQTSDNNNNNDDSNRPYQNVEPSTLQHLLNMNINAPTPRGGYEHNANGNRSHHNGISSHRGLSLSETSEDESVASDQPLNLCVTKSRDSSPGTERSSGKLKKGATNSIDFVDLFESPTRHHTH